MQLLPDSPPAWVVVDLHDGCARCTRCGRIRILPGFMSASELQLLAENFRKDHLRCKAPSAPEAPVAPEEEEP